MGRLARTRQKFPLNNPKAKTQNVLNRSKTFPPISGIKIQSSYKTGRPFFNPAIKKTTRPTTSPIAYFPFPEIPIKIFKLSIHAIPFTRAFEDPALFGHLPAFPVQP